MSNKLLHQHDRPCPITGQPIPGNFIFTDHARPGCFNACRACHQDGRGLAERLNDLDDRMETES